MANPQPGDTLGYNFQDTFAEDVMRSYYAAPESTSLYLLATGGLWLLRRRR